MLAVLKLQEIEVVKCAIKGVDHAADRQIPLASLAPEDHRTLEVSEVILKALDTEPQSSGLRPGR